MDDLDVELDHTTQRPVRPERAHAGHSRLPWLLAALLACAALLATLQWGLPMRSELRTARDELARVRRDAVALQAQVTALEALRDDLAESRAALESDVQQKEQALADLTKTQEELAKGLEAEMRRGDIAITQAHGQLVVDVADKVLFDSGEAQLNDRGREVLRRVGETLLRAQGKIIQVGGHTDAVPISDKLRTRFASNWELSAARATDVVRFLQDEVHIPGPRLQAAGFAEYRPVASNATKNGRRRNRRIELLLLAAPRT